MMGLWTTDDAERVFEIQGGGTPSCKVRCNMEVNDGGDVRLFCCRDLWTKDLIYFFRLGETRVFSGLLVWRLA